MKPVDPRLMKYVGHARRYILGLGGLGALETCLILAQCFLIAGAISPVIDGDKTLPQVLWLVAGTGIVFAARALLKYGREAYGHRAALRTISTLRQKVLRKAGDLGPRWLSEGRSSTTTTLVTSGLDDLEPYFVKFLPQLVLCVLATPVGLATVLILDWVSALIIVFCIPLIPLFMILVGRMTAAFANERLASMQRLGQQLLDLLGGLATLKGLGREKQPARRVKQLGDDYAKKTMQTLYVAFLSGGVLEFLTTLSTALVAVEVGLRMVAGNLDLFTGLTIIMLTPEVFNPIRDVGTQFHASSNGVAASEQALDILEAQDSLQDGKQPAPDLRTSEIRIENLSVLAPGRETVAPAALNGIIRPGQIVALRGTSGSGKSTTAAVLTRFVDPTEGEVTIGGLSVQEISRDDLWKQITWVPQRPVLIPGTVLENIGAPRGEKLEHAAQLAGFSEVVASLPAGWDTMIGQGGTGLSVGQRQRLALTRALLDDSQLVILDEPSAHLDARSENHVVQTVQEIRRQGRTVVVIAHRFALVEVADVVIDVHSDTATPEFLAQHAAVAEAIAHRQETESEIRVAGSRSDNALAAMERSGKKKRAKTQPAPANTPATEVQA
ncbi:cysteine ABC transporter permease [Actinobaculum suis]|nr:cysteine ABC transporter permease [Actinobaculum suis]